MNGSQQIILDKLDGFIKKYYTNILIKGVILFLGLGLLYLLFTSAVEYFLWTNSPTRTVLFFTFIAVQLFLLSRLIVMPLFKLWKLSKGISLEEASILIGNYFPDVSDKLLNFLQLSASQQQSDLLVASIEQKANQLKLVSFVNAINFKTNKKFIPILVLPCIAFGLLYISGNSAIIEQGFSRVVSYNQHFSPPAPFDLQLLSNNLVVEQGNDFVLRVKAVGSVIPETATVVIGSETYILQAESNGVFSYRFVAASKDISFFVQANKVKSKPYLLKVVNVPSIVNFEMNLVYPNYLNRKSESIKGTGNIIVPEGTRIFWKVNTQATTKVTFNNDKTSVNFQRSENMFYHRALIKKEIDYQIITSNNELKNFEKLIYKINVQNDAFPTIDVNFVNVAELFDGQYLVGQVGDDHGLSKLQIVYYGKGSTVFNRSKIEISSSTSDQFSFAFPGDLKVTKGVDYDYYFEIFDNDAVNGLKSAKSAVFSSKILSDDESKDKMLQQQNENIGALSKSLEGQNKRMSDLDKLKKTSKEKDNLDYNDQQKVLDFVKQQQKDNEQMKVYSNRLKENLQKNKDADKASLKEQLQKRLDKQLSDIDKNNKLLDELKELSNKLKQDDLMEKLDRFKQKSSSQSKNLEQLVELTKRFYVEQKVNQLADKLDKLASKQEEAAEKITDDSKEKQSKINQEFDDIRNDLKELDKNNNELKSPMDLPDNEQKSKSIDDDLKKASEELNKASKSALDKAKSKQKSAAKQMKEMAESMKDGMESESAEKEEEDAAMLRQILDNLLSFSFSEEQTMSQFKSIRRSSPSYNKNLKQQQDLRLQFQHVDDSLFALGLRNPKITELINEEVGNVHYNINKSIENLVEANVSKGVYHQQYTVSSANKLADMLSESLNNMQMSMQASGKKGGKPKKGNGSGMQLPDIIKKQGELAEKIKNGQKDGKSGQGSKSGKDGQQGKEGQSKDGRGNEDGEGNAEEILKIYQEQKQLRDELQKQLKEKGIDASGQNALNTMKDIEKQLLNKGFKNDVLQKMLNLKQELLKLDKALQTQGEENKREADKAKNQFSNGANALPAAVTEYMNSIEILNRQALPLQKNFSDKVNSYFKK